MLNNEMPFSADTTDKRQGATDDVGYYGERPVQPNEDCCPRLQENGSCLQVYL